MASLRWFADHNQVTTQTRLAEHARIEPMTLSKADDAFFGRLNARDLASYKALTVALVEGEHG